MYYNSLLEKIGNTPIIKLNKFMSNRNLKADIFAKVEFFEPCSSIKDRTAFCMLEQAKLRGEINEQTVIIEPTSGNTGIGLAWICAIMGYKLILTIPENMSIERIKILKQLGADIILTNAALGMQGAVDKAKELHVLTDNSFVPSQFDNYDNCLAHVATAKEILQDLNNDIDFFVAGIGTGGTITGAGETLKKHLPDIKIIGVEPKSSPLITENYSGKHNLQGIGANFIPKILNLDLLDQVITISDNEAISCAKALAKEEGLLVGITSGASVFAAYKLAILPENKGKKIVAILPDTGERYLSTVLFD